MWLINCKSVQEQLKLEWFLDHEAPPYAILSHRWEEDEFLFEDAKYGTGRQKIGFKKVEAFCKQAMMDGYEYGWDDTCCINKESSAELSEAINSMFRWYGSARVCYAYLSDVSSDLSKDEQDKCFRESVWFTRGWTLQELLAPKKLIFFTADWVAFTSRNASSKTISDVTGITPLALIGSLDAIHGFSIARRMSWASKRVTSRPEDITYSLLGIMDVNMPMLYGEGGEKAFIRLQEEIVKNSNDATIFAWDPPDDDSETMGFGILARSPREFSNSSQFHPRNEEPITFQFESTNQGIRFNTKSLVIRGDPVVHAALNVVDRLRRDCIVAIPIFRAGSSSSRRYFRGRGEIRRISNDSIARQDDLVALYISKRASRLKDSISFLLRGIPCRLHECESYPPKRITTAKNFEVGTDITVRPPIQHDTRVLTPVLKDAKGCWWVVVAFSVKQIAVKKSSEVYVFVVWDNIFKMGWIHPVCYGGDSKRPSLQYAWENFDVFGSGNRRHLDSAVILDQVVPPMSSGSVRQRKIDFEMLHFESTGADSWELHHKTEIVVQARQSFHLLSSNATIPWQAELNRVIAYQQQKLKDQKVLENLQKKHAKKLMEIHSARTEEGRIKGRRDLGNIESELGIAISSLHETQDIFKD